MKSLTINLTEDLANRLQSAAEKLEIQPKVLVQMGIQEKLDQLEEEFQQASDYVLYKNWELYQRLA